MQLLNEGSADTQIEKAYKEAFVTVNKKLHESTEIDDSMSGTTASA